MENNVKIVINRNGEYLTLELSEDFPISLNYSIADIKDITKRSGNFSKTLSIPSTPNNDNVFNDLFDIRSTLYKFDLTKKYTCVLYKNDIEQFRGYIVLNNISKNPNSNHFSDDVNMVYNCTLFSQTVDFFTTISDRELDDIDFNLPRHQLYLNTIRSYSANTYLDTFKYFNFNNNGANYYSFNDFWPAIFVKSYIDHIVADAGYHYDNTQSSFMASDPFTKLITPYAGSVNVKNSNEWESEKFYGGEPLTATTSITKTFNATNQNVNYFSYDFSFSDYSTYPYFSNDYGQPIGKKYKVTSLNGLQYINVKLDGSIQYLAATDCWYSDVEGKNISQLEQTIHRNKTQYLTIYVIKNGVFFTSGFVGIDCLPIREHYSTTTPDMEGGMTYTYNFNETIQIPCQLNINDEIELRFIFYPFKQGPMWFDSCGCGGGTFQYVSWPVATLVYPTYTLKLNDTSWWNIPENTSTRSYGDYININNYIPQGVKQTDYISNVAKMFNVYIDEDKNFHNRLVFKTRDDYYNTNVYKDWSGKIDRNKEIEIKYLSDLTKAKTILTYKEGSDEYTKKYKEYFNKTYGSKDIIFNSEILIGEEKKEFIFSSCPLVYNNGLTVAAVNATAPTNDLYILYDGGIIDGMWKFLDYDNTQKTFYQYNYAGHFDNPTLPSLDLNFGDCNAYFINNNFYTDNNLFNLYHYNLYRNISEQKMMTAYFYLNETDITNLNLSDKIIVDHIIYIINSITDYNPYNNNSVKVELIQYDDIYSKPRERKRPIRLSATTISNINFLIDNGLTNNNTNFVGSQSSNIAIDGIYNNVNGQNINIAGNFNTVSANDVSILGSGWNITGNTDGQLKIIGDYRGQEITSDSIILSAPNIILDGIIQLDGSLDHNTLTNLQGGTTNEYYHLTSNQYHVVQNPLWISGSTGSYSIKTNNGSGNDATGNYALSEGFKTNAIGVASHAEGNTTAATGAYSHSEGRNTQATNSQAHAEGFTSLATGDSSHAEGYQTRATGAYSHSQNRDTRATGDYTYAGGYNSQATGSTSFVHSYNSVAGGARSAVIGGQNIYGYADDTVYVPNLYVINNTFVDGEFSADTIYADTIFTHTISGMSPVNINDVIVENGTLLATSMTGNTLIVNNNVGIGTTTPYAKLDVNGNVIISGKTQITSSVQIGDDTTGASSINAGAIRYRSDSNNSYCEMVMQTGSTEYGWVIIKQNTW